MYSILMHKMRLEIRLFKCYFRPCQYCMLNKQEYHIVLIIVIFYLNSVMDMFFTIYMHFCKKKNTSFLTITASLFVFTITLFETTILLTLKTKTWKSTRLVTILANKTDWTTCKKLRRFVIHYKGIK